MPRSSETDSGSTAISRLPYSEALHWIAQMGNLDAVKSEISAGAEVDERNKDGWTPLHYAVDADKISVAETLIAHGVDVDTQNNEGQSPLGIARFFRSKSVEKLLSAYGAKQ